MTLIDPPNGKWLDRWGACRVCGGEIPHGHTNECDHYILEQAATSLRARLATAEGERDEARELVSHCWVHSSYSDCGFMQMTTPQKQLYCDIVGGTVEERLADHRKRDEELKANPVLPAPLQIAALTAERDEARAEVERLKAALDGTDLEILTTEDRAALEGLGDDFVDHLIVDAHKPALPAGRSDETPAGKPVSEAESHDHLAGITHVRVMTPEQYHAYVHGADIPAMPVAEYIERYRTNKVAVASPLADPEWPTISVQRGDLYFDDVRIDTDVDALVVEWLESHWPDIARAFIVPYLTELARLREAVRWLVGRYVSSSTVYSLYGSVEGTRRFVDYAAGLHPVIRSACTDTAGAGDGGNNVEEAT